MQPSIRPPWSFYLADIDRDDMLPLLDGTDAPSDNARATSTECVKVASNRAQVATNPRGEVTPWTSKNT